MSAQESKAKKRGSRSRLLLFGGLAVIVITALVLLFGLNSAATSTEAAVETADQSTVPEQILLPASGRPLQVGDLPYAFSLASLEGEQVALNEFIGRPLIINFWATWCGPCRIEMPHLQHTFEAHQDDGLAVLALNQDETAEEVNEFFNEFGLTFTPLLDEGKATAENYGAGRALPTSFFINGEGQITAIHRGPMTQSQIDGYLAVTIPPS